MSKSVGKVKVWREGDRERVCLEFWVDGVCRRIYSDVDRWGRRIGLTEDSARALLEDIQAEVRRRRSIEDALAPFLGRSAPENLFERRWGRYLEQKRRDAATGRISRGHLRELEGIERRGYLAFLRERSIHEIDYGALEDWLVWLAQSKPDLGARTRKHALTAVMGCLRWLRKRGDIDEAPDPPEILVDEHAPTLLTEEARTAILEAIPEDARGIFLALCYVGLRPSEARALDCSALQDGYLLVDRAAEDNRASGKTRGTKTRRIRRLPIPDDLAAWIDKHVSPADRLQGAPLFRNPRGKTKTKRWSPSAMDRTWDRAQIRALGRKVASLYEGTRHTFATLALNSGAEMYHVQRFLGHTDQRTTERYARLADSSLRSVIQTRDRLQGSSGGSGELSTFPKNP